jgi:hypothetical protein
MAGAVVDLRPGRPEDDRAEQHRRVRCGWSAGSCFGTGAVSAMEIVIPHDPEASGSQKSPDIGGDAEVADRLADLAKDCDGDASTTPE